MIYLLFPLFFMLHELEEIAFMPNWVVKIKKNANSRFVNLIPTTKAKNFALMVLEEYLVLLIIAVICYKKQAINFYLALMLVYNLHILVHIVQSLVLKSYIPGLFLGIVSFGLVGWLMCWQIAAINWIRVFLFLPLVVTAIVANLVLIHQVDHWKN
ncbi:HXXEE domain-containing protein [Oenococcus sp.]|uniref:HXXEE domain-containing protein n=1 Tax=Oenococcus sp. TaxID=1979414 RepID=UPI0039EA8FB9